MVIATLTGLIFSNELRDQRVRREFLLAITLGVALVFLHLQSKGYDNAHTVVSPSVKTSVDEAVSEVQPDIVQAIPQSTTVDFRSSSVAHRETKVIGEFLDVESEAGQFEVAAPNRSIGTRLDPSDISSGEPTDKAISRGRFSDPSDPVYALSFGRPLHIGDFVDAAEHFLRVDASSVSVSIGEDVVVESF